MKDELASPRARREMRLRAQDLRRRQTPCEGILWEALRRKNFFGCKFRRQSPIGRFILDFLCFQHRLIIEVDGGIHKLQKEHDEEREQYLREFHYRILRFTNEEVEESLPMVLKEIAKALGKDM